MLSTLGCKLSRKKDLCIGFGCVINSLEGLHEVNDVLDRRGHRWWIFCDGCKHLVRERRSQTKERLKCVFLAIDERNSRRVDTQGTML